jgi:hypothetical protein
VSRWLTAAIARLTNLKDNFPCLKTKRKRQSRGQAGPSPQTAGSFGGQGGKNGDDLSKEKFGKGLEKYRHEYLNQQRSQSLNKK